MRDHCHIVGRYRGVAHIECNLMYRISKSGWKLPVVIHNPKGYDGHLIVKALKSEFGKVQVIPQNMEKYLPLAVGKLKFVDSFHFTPKGLDVLAKTLADDEFRYFRESCTCNHFGLIRRNCVYPYDYMDSCDRCDETKLHSQDASFSKLSGSPCSDSEYTHVTPVWTAFGCRTMADYHDIYLQLDVLLLADVFERFRTTCLECYSLGSVHYYTMPGLACDAALRMSRVNLKLITDVDMYHFVENIIRGGISMISTRHAQANSPSFPDTYDSSLPNQNLTYLDANNLYGWAMSQSLPTHGFRFLQQDEISTLKLQELSDDAEDGYILKVDLHYPTHLHDCHDDYLLAPSHE